MQHKVTPGGHIMQMDTQSLRALCARRGASPHEFFIDVMKGKLPCYDCDGSGKLRYLLSKKRQAPCECGGETAHCWRCEGKGTAIRDERVCVTCHGDGRGRITYETRLNAAREMAQYVAPKLRQVDHISSDDSQRPRWEVVIVDNQQRTVGGSGVARPSIQAPKE
jgi:RecJ-like exonuclease